jgi:small ligand-binding sensory domain FIST
MSQQTEGSPNLPGGAYSELVIGPYDESRVQEAAKRAQEHLHGKAGIAFVFVSCDYEPHVHDLTELIQIHARCPQVVGCSAGGLIGTGEEDENESGFSLLVLQVPQDEVAVFELPPESTGPIWEQAKRFNREEANGWILLGNPVMVGEDWMGRWHEAMGATPTYGGLVSGSFRGEELFTFTDKELSAAAAIAVGIRGELHFGGLVSQGCRPIGEPLTITKADHNLIHQLASVSAYEQLQAAFHSLPDDQREKAQGNILVGLAMTEYVEEFHTGDFLVRSILGGDPSQGILAVGAMPRVGQTMQFQLRDRDAADNELRELLLQKRHTLGTRPFAALLFSCAGRGHHLFGTPSHDAGLVREVFGNVPLAGFFCNGEIGSVGQRAYLHGFTASAVLFVRREDA